MPINPEDNRNAVEQLEKELAEQSRKARAKERQDHILYEREKERQSVIRRAKEKREHEARERDHRQNAESVKIYSLWP